MKTVAFLFFFFLATTLLQAAQPQVSGKFTGHVGKQIKLYIYNGLNRIEFSKSEIDSQGHFILGYPEDYSGMGYLEIESGSGISLVLNEPDIRLNGPYILETGSNSFENSIENSLYYKYLDNHKIFGDSIAPLQQTLAQPFQILSLAERKQEAVNKGRIMQIRANELKFLSGFDKGTYVSWYLSVRRFIDDMWAQQAYGPDFITVKIVEFRKLNLSDKQLCSSGILNGLLKAHFVLIEKLNEPESVIYSEIDRSIDFIVDELQGRNDELLAQVNGFLLDLFGKRGLVKASEHLNLAMKSNNKLPDFKN